MAGLGLGDFLKHNEDSGGGRRKFFNWKKEGAATVWLSTRAAIAYPSWNHPFMSVATWEDKESGEEREALRFNRFASPDAEIVHKSQHFREDDDRLQIKPLLDPFLLLREWLRLEADHIPNDTVIFRWVDPKNGEVTEWRKGRLARLVEKTGSDWNHSLDTKLEYLFVVVDNDNPAEGPQIVRAPKSLGDKMKEAIGQEMASNGPEQGNPLVTPYAFRWIFDKNAKSPMNYYRAFRYNKAEMTPAIREAIMNPDFPDPTIDTAPRPGDKMKIRAAMEDAAQVDLPWERFFVDAWHNEEEGQSAGATSTGTSGAATDFNYGANVEKPAASASEEPKPRTRRRKKKEEPAPPPEPERIPCDDCGHMMLPTESVCKGCGAEYEVEAGEETAADHVPPPSETTTTPAAPLSDAKCWSCGSEVVDDRCTECGLDVSDDLPYG